MPAKNKPVTRTYWPNCAVCQFMKKNRDFRMRVMQSTYFNPDGTESLSAVSRAFGDPFPGSSLRTHMVRHQKRDIIRAEAKINPIETTNPVGVMLDATGDHIGSLKNFIREGDAKLQKGEMSITATTYLQAIKIMADVEKGNKDRKFDAMKFMMGANSASNIPADRGTTKT